ncbi:DUF4862 family protein [Corynebacterium pelargi]|uniref:Uncharacterized protein n=1 Tax=Corynebacterium pelargi TaxID=1471400 RepID=A0A410W961_9CORY|nr:DUF4862 family protein [Corynebacterium pelargi]QAU52493.1 hypothetical protein CPELA_06130 [Corynebacterium pelargi]GGG76784.1 DUF4862 domain-containing protein [Corynebacterium pelargi]
MSYFVVGAYASQPPELDAQRRYYDLLAETGWVDGLEVPYPGQMHEGFLGSLLEGRFQHSVLTAIPGTMVNVWDDPDFGLGSPTAAGRAKAMEFCAQLRNSLEAMHREHGHIFDWVALHSAPSNRSTAEDFQASLKELLTWDWCGAKIVIEHCDERSDEHEAEKGFLLLEEELAIAQELGLHCSLNWGRSAVGSRGDIRPQQHVNQAKASGVLAGVIFSGASPQTTQYGPAWIDGHLPLSLDEPASLMTPEQVAQSCALAGDVDYLGAKCCAPKDASLEQRLAMIERIYRCCQA